MRRQKYVYAAKTHGYLSLKTRKGKPQYKVTVIVNRPKSDFLPPFVNTVDVHFTIFPSIYIASHSIM